MFAYLNLSHEEPFPYPISTNVSTHPAFYSDDFLKELGLPPDHNKRVEKELAELEKKKEVAAKK